MDLSHNQLCGLYYDDDGELQGTYTAEGITAVANALKVTPSLTSVSLANNMISGIGGEHADGSGELRGTFSIEGIAAIAGALSKNTSLQSVDLSSNSLAGVNRSGHGTFHPEGIKAIAEALKVTASLTKLDVQYNRLGEEGKAALRKAVEGRSGFELVVPSQSVP